MNNNIQGVYKRSVSLAIIVGWANLNGIMSSNIYRESDAPWYRVGHSILLAYTAVFLVGGSIVNMIFLNIGNKRRDRENAMNNESTPIGPDKCFDDFHPDFRYTL